MLSPNTILKFMSAFLEALLTI